MAYPFIFAEFFFTTFFFSSLVLSRFRLPRGAGGGMVLMVAPGTPTEDPNTRTMIFENEYINGEYYRYQMGLRDLFYTFYLLKINWPKHC